MRTQTPATDRLHIEANGREGGNREAEARAEREEGLEVGIIRRGHVNLRKKITRSRIRMMAARARVAGMSSVAVAVGDIREDA